jgi:hypothetical protein
MPNCPLTSDTLGELTVTGLAPTANAIAIIFAPGAALGAQLRDNANQNIPANYLEGENANANDPIFTTAINSSAFNDRVLALTNADFMPVVEQRVAREMIAILTSYKAAKGYYPWADDGTDPGKSVDGINRGRFPCDTARPDNWGSGTPTLPNWLKNGCKQITPGWAGILYYTAAKGQLHSGCTTCISSSLSVTGLTGNKELVLITPGATSANPRGVWPAAYFEDAENSDNINDTYVTPTSTAYNRDRLFSIP